METLIECRIEDAIACITLHRPAALHAMNPPLLLRLREVLEGLATDEDVRAVIVTGSGERAFSAGADIAWLNAAGPLEVRELARLAVEVNRRIETLGKPVIAALNGDALGGGLELAEACALRICAAHAKLGHPEVRIGAVAGFGGTTRLPRLVGKGRAAEMLLTGRVIDAKEALDIGLVNRVVPAADVLPLARSVAHELASLPAPAVRLTWEALHRGLDIGPEPSTALGADYFGLVAATPEFRVGTGRFLERRRAAE